MQEFPFCCKGFDLINSGKHISVCFLCLQVQVTLINIHDKTVHIHEVVISLTRILSLISKQISAFRISYIQSCFFFYFTKDSLAGFLTCLGCTPSYFPPAGSACLGHHTFGNQECTSWSADYTKYGQVILPVLQTPVISFHCASCRFLIFIINIPKFHF